MENNIDRGDTGLAGELWAAMGPRERLVQESKLVLSAVAQEAELEYELAVRRNELLQPNDLFHCSGLQAALRRVEVQLQECLSRIPASVEERRAKDAAKLPSKAFAVTRSRYESTSGIR